LNLSGSFVVVGDLHGNIDDLLRVFGRFSYPPVQSYLFLGDYVDRGKNSIETILLLYALKVLFPTHIYLLRGNHECEIISTNYGFKAECTRFFKKRRSFHRLCESFSHLAVAAVVNDSIFCVHGGLSPSIIELSDLTDQIQKPIVDLSRSIAEDLLWSDPCSSVGKFADSPRKTGFLFGQESLDLFLGANGLMCLIRAHEFCPSGTKMELNGCLTVFTACNYCGRCNDGAVAVIRSDARIDISRFRVENTAHRNFLMPPWICGNPGAPLEPLYREAENFAVMRIEIPVV
jgi:protein phosphatase